MLRSLDECVQNDVMLGFMKTNRWLRGIEIPRSLRTSTFFSFHLLVRPQADQVLSKRHHSSNSFVRDIHSAYKARVAYEDETGERTLRYSSTISWIRPTV
jgi:hypothetical protein